jgi:hypothetical protein
VPLCRLGPSGRPRVWIPFELCNACCIAVPSRDRTRWFHALFDKVARSDVMWRAWVDVATNQGAPGIVPTGAVRYRGVPYSCGQPLGVAGPNPCGRPTEVRMASLAGSSRAAHRAPRCRPICLPSALRSPRAEAQGFHLKPGRRHHQRAASPSAAPCDRRLPSEIGLIDPVMVFAFSR